MQKIKEATAELFREFFTEALTADNGYPHRVYTYHAAQGREPFLCETVEGER